jgi:hypothetical protein
MTHSGSLTLDAIIAGLTTSKVFLQLHTSAAFEQGSDGAKCTVTLPSQCVSMSLLGSGQPSIIQSKTSPIIQSKTSPIIQSKTSPIIQSKTAPIIQSKTAPIIQSKTAPIIQSKTSPIIQQEQPIVKLEPVDVYPTLKSLKAMKVLDIREMATSKGISINYIIDGKNKTRLKDELISEILIAFKN